ncbi:YtpI family protein [Aneurinibacillus tyrosinisolvens]|jgi:hypothetical protein|uniref:YtpI family protein n=1 Tax=Aneurinibacillus tyrosinisolvens TaxID=1443435 RepID=UPI00063FA985|nr:YtpI family protein [Aneurinibacillus tyrosinisolvens]
MSFIALITIAAIVAGLYYSFSWRRQPGVMARIYQARMNVSFGVFLLGLAINQFAFTDLSAIRIIIGIVFLLIGAVNLVTGLRNHVYFMKRKNEESKG